MSDYILKNDSLILTLSDFGAELTSIIEVSTNTEYLWNANPAFWKRHSPILFPFVGTLKDKSYRYNNRSYPMTPHGFARDMVFSLKLHTEDEIWFSLDANEETLRKYPFLFRLELGYHLHGKSITVLWKVINNDNKTMYFSIGGHPAFNCPLNPIRNQNDYFLLFDNTELRYLHIDEHGLVQKKPMRAQNLLTTDQGLLPIDPHMFDLDALIIENNQCHKVSLLRPSQAPYLTVTFDAPLFGLWSPAKMNAPFVCIEPWYGRCDASDFNDTLENREWGNSLEVGKQFSESYTIEIC
ncbi:MAG: aldose 1-epimerase family protein [Mobilitalea sp.]